MAKGKIVKRKKREKTTLPMRAKKWEKSLTPEGVKRINELIDRRGYYFDYIALGIMGDLPPAYVKMTARHQSRVAATIALDNIGVSRSGSESNQLRERVYKITGEMGKVFADSLIAGLDFQRAHLLMVSGRDAAIEGEALLRKTKQIIPQSQQNIRELETAISTILGKEKARAFLRCFYTEYKKLSDESLKNIRKLKEMSDHPGLK